MKCPLNLQIARKAIEKRAHGTFRTRVGHLPGGSFRAHSVILGTLVSTHKKARHERAGKAQYL